MQITEQNNFCQDLQKNCVNDGNMYLNYIFLLRCANYRNRYLNNQFLKCACDWFGGSGFLQEPDCLGEKTVGNPLGFGPEASVSFPRWQ